MERGIRELVAALDHENEHLAEAAQAELTERYGAEALEPLIEAAPAFGDFGRLCAIEIFEAIGDARAGPVLVPWLKCDDDTVREWSAGALGRLHVAEAVPALLEAWEASKARGTPPSWTEPARIRYALAVLDARTVVLPEPAGRLGVEDDLLGRAWPAEVLSDALEALAEASQVVLYFQYWARRPDLDPSDWFGVVEAGSNIELDWREPWDALVEASREQAVAAAEAAALPPGTLATIEWIDRRDV